MQDQRNI